MDQETLNAINAVAAVFSAIGTVGAVVVALHLARRDQSQRLKVQVDAGGTASRTGGQYGFIVAVTNIGRRSVQVNGLEFRYRENGETARFLLNPPESDHSCSPLPIKLEDGDQALYIMPLSDLHNLFEKVSNPEIALRSLRFVVKVTAGKEIVVKPGQLLQRQLRERRHPMLEMGSS